VKDHAYFREWSAAFVLGALDSDDRAAFELHLSDCEKCQQDVARFAPLPGLLNRSQVDEIAAPPRVVELATGAIADEWHNLRRSRRRWQWVAGVAAAFVVMAVVVPALFQGGTDEGTSIALTPGSSATGSVLVVERTWGTAVEIDVANLPDSDTYVAWAVSVDGRWDQMATWGPTPASRAKVSGASSIATHDLDRVVITTADKADTVGIAPMTVAGTG